MPSFFFRELQLISFTFNSQFLYELKRMLYLFKTVCEMFIFDFISFLLKFMFLFNKKHGLVNFETSYLLK